MEYDQIGDLDRRLWMSMTKSDKRVAMIAKRG
jgi:hypothetical protein